MHCWLAREQLLLSDTELLCSYCLCLGLIPPAHERRAAIDTWVRIQPTYHAYLYYPLRFLDTLGEELPQAIVN